jgi:hypothetical protein
MKKLFLTAAIITFFAFSITTSAKVSGEDSIYPQTFIVCGIDKSDFYLTDEINVITPNEELPEEIDAIIEDIKDNKIHDLVLAYYVSTSFFYKSDIHELAYTTKATAYT